jgi:hypothetical protein
MATDLDLDESLIREAQQLGCHETQAKAVNAALREYIKRRADLHGRPGLRPLCPVSAGTAPPPHGTMNMARRSAGI